MQSFQIRQPNEEGKGPYSMEQLETLAISGKVDQETLYWVEGEDLWKPIIENPELSARLFPQKLEMKIRKPAPVAGEKSTPGEGSHDDLSRILQKEYKADLASEKREARRFVWDTLPFWGMIAGVILIFGALSLLRPHLSALSDVFSNLSILKEQPILIIGLLDILVALLLILGATSFSHYLRIRFGILAGIAILYGWVGYHFSHSLETILAFIGVILFTSFRWGIVQAIGGGIALITTLIIILSGGYSF